MRGLPQHYLSHPTTTAAGSRHSHSRSIHFDIGCARELALTRRRTVAGASGQGRAIGMRAVSLVDAYRHQHLAQSSWGTFGNGVASYSRFMVYHHPNEPLLPATDANIAGWFAASALTCCHATLRNYFHGLQAFHRKHNVPCTPLSALVQARETLKGIKRVRGDMPRRVQALSPQDLRKVSNVVVARSGVTNRSVRDKFNDRTVATAMKVGFFAMLRKSNLTGPKALSRSDVTVTTRSDGAKVMWVTMRYSKVIQNGERVHRLPLTETGDELCPVSAFLAHVSECPAPGESNAFLWATGNGAAPSFVPLTHESMTRHMRGMLAEAGLFPNLYTGHSLRRGGATLAFELGASVQDIKRHGDWSSDVVYTYHQVSDDTLCALPTRMAAAAARR
jgi:hypothetical protein